MEYQLDLAPTEQDVEEIRAGLIQHNTPFLHGINSERIGYYLVVNEKKHAGIIADIWGNWLLIKFLWVDESMRGQRVGAKLLAKLEGYAKSKGCHSALVDTLSFQAKPFYEKQGYTCQLILDNYPLNTQLSFLTKSI